MSARLTAQDQDQEVKDAAISAAAALVAGLGDLLSTQVPPMLKVRPLPHLSVWRLACVVYGRGVGCRCLSHAGHRSREWGLRREDRVLGLRAQGLRIEAYESGLGCLGLSRSGYNEALVERLDNISILMSPNPGPFSFSTRCSFTTRTRV